MSEVEKEILEIINEIVEGCYIGRLKVIIDKYYKNYNCANPCEKTLLNLDYSLRLYLNSDYEPITMSYMTTRQYNYKKWKNQEKDPGWEPEELFYKRSLKEFKEFLCEEFKNRMLQQVDYYRIILQLPSIDCNEQGKRDREN